MTKPCTCDLCERHRRIERIAAKGTRAEMRALILELDDALGNTEFELEVDEAILDGSWPTAREYANRILERCAPVTAGGGKE